MATTFGGEDLGNAPAQGSTAYTKENFPYQQYIDDNPGIGGGKNHYGIEDKERAWADYLAKNPSGGNSAGAGSLGNATNIVAGAPKNPGDVNIGQAASDIVKDPSTLISGDRSLEEQAAKDQMTGNEAGTTINPNDPKYQTDTDKLNQEAKTAEAETAAKVDPREAETYDVEKVADKVAGEDMTGAKGEVSDETIINAPQIDLESISKGTDAGGVGEALKDYAVQEFDDVDKRATAKGQLEALQDDFVDPITGEPKIPNWAAATARSVAKLTAFTGASGSAATAAMSQALMEASIPIATSDAQFYQTLTIKNLDNKQASILNRANVLAKMELANQDSRLTAAVENSKNFLAMDLANLNNEQQAAVINNQNRVNAILEDGKQENAKRLFTADSQNKMDMFYDQLNSQIEQFNTGQVNGMAQFNTDQVNSMSQFNANLENNREQFYQNMQYAIDTANAKWRQTVTLTEDQQAFEAAATDVKNMVGMTSEQLAQLWDRSDSLLQFAWQSGENEADRKAQMAIAKFQSKMAGKNADKEGLGSLVGGLASSAFDKVLDKW